MRDPNNQIHVVKNLKISVSNVVTEPPHHTSTRRLLNEVVSASQPAEGLVTNVITAGDYDLNISGKLGLGPLGEELKVRRWGLAHVRMQLMRGEVLSMLCFFFFIQYACNTQLFYHTLS